MNLTRGEIINRLSYFGLVVIIFTLGFATSYLLIDPNRPSFKEIRSSTGYHFINPLLECEITSFDRPRLGSLRENINDLIDREIEEKQLSLVSLYYRDLNNGPWFGINESELFSPASLIKVPLLMVIYKEAETKPSLLSQTITYDPKKFPDGDQNFPPDKKLVPGQNYTIEQLLHQMIVYSDNVAYNILLSTISPSLLLQVYKDLDVDISRSINDPAGNIITVIDYASFYRILFNSSYLSKRMSEKALELLSRTEFRDGLVAGVPSGTPVAHKFGERRYLETGEKQLHDCGIIYHPSRPYLLCIMTRGQDFPKMSDTIKDISRSFYEQLSSKP